MKSFKFILISSLIALSGAAHANDKPPGSINSIEMAADVGSHYFDYMHFRPIGVCIWKQEIAGIPIYVPTPEYSEYLPDLIVSVYNKKGDDPWGLANDTFDIASQAVGNATMQALTGDSLTDGRNTSVRGENHADSDITKSVDVIGAPTDLLHIPFAMLRLNTLPYMPYFQSALDSVPGRFGIAEDLEPETWNPLGYFIGPYSNNKLNFLNQWAYEFPRTMGVDNSNDYKASVSIAMHGVDIVTNNNTLHVVQSTSDSCGQNCAVANVIPEATDKNEIWEEVYPNDRHITPGKSDLKDLKPIGKSDDVAGHGNYVFVIWRHYKGCVQAGGELIYKTVNVPPTHKR